MGRVKVWLKRSYIIATSLIAIISVLLLALTLFSHGFLHKEEEIEQILVGLQSLYALSLVPLLLCIIGVFGICKQKKWALIVFAVGMILGCLVLILCEIQALVTLPEVPEEIRNHYRSYVPLSTGSRDRISDKIQELQAKHQCCGVGEGYRDWGRQFPNSCLCTEESTSPCELAPWSGSLTPRGTVPPIRIYNESCLPHLIAHQMATLNYVMGAMLGVILLWLLSVVQCILILCQLNQKEETPTVAYRPEGKSGNYITLSDPADNI